jgi:hypothetical protein
MVRRLVLETKKDDVVVQGNVASRVTGILMELFK